MCPAWYHGTCVAELHFPHLQDEDKVPKNGGHETHEAMQIQDKAGRRYLTIAINTIVNEPERNWYTLQTLGAILI